MRASVTTVLDVAGGALVVGAIGCWSVPGAMLTAGIGLLAASWRATTARGDRS